MNNTESKEPLYRQLNKERIDNIMFAASNGIGLYVNGSGISFLDLDNKAISYTDIEQTKLDPTLEYAALAVNNLSSLAEALEELISECNFIPKEVFTEAGKDSFQDSLNKAKEALLKIS